MSATTSKAKWGVSGPSAGTGIVWETVNTTSSPVTADVPDEDGAVVEIVKYDTRYEFNGTCHGPNAPSFDGDKFTHDGQTYCVDAIEEAGTYNNITRWTVRGHAFAKCSTVTDVSSGS